MYEVKMLKNYFQFIIDEHSSKDNLWAFVLVQERNFYFIFLGKQNNIPHVNVSNESSIN